MGGGSVCEMCPSYSPNGVWANGHIPLSGGGLWRPPCLLKPRNGGGCSKRLPGSGFIVGGEKRRCAVSKQPSTISRGFATSSANSVLGCEVSNVRHSGPRTTIRSRTISKPDCVSGKDLF